MKQKHHVILIHGTWGKGELWADLAAELKHRGYTVHAPTLRHHELPFAEGAALVGKVSLLDYVADLAVLLRGLDSPPIIVGHSLGGLLAQLLAARHAHKALLLLAPAPAPGIFATYPSTTRLFFRHFLQWGFWRKPVQPPAWEDWSERCVNEQPHAIQERRFKRLSTESGRAYAEMVFWYLDPQRAARVDFDAIRTPVLVIAGARDRVLPTPIARKTAARYRNARYAELPHAGHVMTEGPHLAATLAYIDRWLAQNQLLPAAVATGNGGNAKA